MKVYINTTNENYGLPRFFVKYLEKYGLVDRTNKYIVLNLDTISTLEKGSRCTVYIEADNFLKQGCFPDRYEQSDLFYIPSLNHASNYPKKTRYLPLGIDPEIHYPRPVEKKYTYVFVGRYTNDQVYSHRKEVLEQLQEKEKSLLVTEGTQETYCDVMCSGKIMLNILPKRGEDVCVNMRMAEAMAMGVLMNDYHPNIDKYGFIKNVHYLPLDRFGEDFSDEELQSIHEAGRAYVLKHYNVQDSVNKLIHDIEEFIGEKLC